MTERAFFDTNVLIYSYFLQSEDKAKRSREVMKNGGWISSQVVAETCRILLHKAGYSMEEIKTVISECYYAFRVLPLDKNVFLGAADLREKFALSYWDSLIVASANEAQCDILYSEDFQHGLNTGQTRIINPFI